MQGLRLGKVPEQELTLLQWFISLIKIISWKMWISSGSFQILGRWSNGEASKYWEINITVSRMNSCLSAQDAVVAAPSLTGKSGKEAQLPRSPQRPFLRPRSAAQHLAAFVCGQLEHSREHRWFWSAQHTTGAATNKQRPACAFN